MQAATPEETRRRWGNLWMDSISLIISLSPWLSKQDSCLGFIFFFLKIKKMFMIHHEGLLHIQWLKVWEKEIQPCNSHMIRVLITFWSSFFVFGHHFLKRLFHKIWGKISFVKQFYCWFISVYFKTKIRNPSKVIMMNIKEIVKNEI